MCAERRAAIVCGDRYAATMGRHDLPSAFSEDELRAFMKAILADVHALDDLGLARAHRDHVAGLGEDDP